MSEHMSTPDVQPAPRQGWLVGRYRQGKRAWREHVRRTKALPDDYRWVMEQIERFMWNFAGNAQMVPVLDGVLDLMEEGAAAGREVLAVTGPDVAGFALGVLAEVQAATWTGKKAAQLNRAVQRRLAPDAGASSE